MHLSLNTGCFYLFLPPDTYKTIGKSRDSNMSGRDNIANIHLKHTTTKRIATFTNNGQITRAWKLDKIGIKQFFLTGASAINPYYFGKPFVLQDLIDPFNRKPLH